ncbi:hypothetical protein CKM354_000321600 [Cercospora kikuchii]|uniref:Uncharacterized protein n=1 Tax=Cercospora kikuchii TaxID=84275 RepID=A0A9P3C931_9PEZI|nr:uncharacterized protein CKM354_000321600 [Cercospora kikuchii]GIZ39849.1 hypothetical protein CKM354_000321600 [Cercospora kikuchii]
MRNETVNSAPHSSNTLPGRFILSLGEVISNGFDLISEALMPGLQSDDFDNLSLPQRDVNGSTDIPVDARPDVKMTSHRQNDTDVGIHASHGFSGMPDNVGSMLYGPLSTPHRHCLLQRSFSAPNLPSPQHVSFKRSRASSVPEPEADSAAYPQVPREDASLPAVGTTSKAISSDIPEAITAPELGVLPEEYGQDIQMTHKLAPEDDTDAQSLETSGHVNVRNREDSCAPPAAAEPRRMNIQDEHHRAFNEIANSLPVDRAGIAGQREDLENDVENEGSSISPHARTIDSGFAKQEAVEPESAQNTQLQSPSFSPLTETGQSKLRRSTRGSFELEGDAWIPQTPKVGPSVGTSNGFEQLKKSLRMTPILKMGESPEQATKRRSTLQKPHRPDTADSQQQGRKDFGGGLVT